MLFALLRSVALVLSISLDALAAPPTPTTPPTSALSVNIRRSIKHRSPNDVHAWAVAQADKIRNRYGASEKRQKRGSGSNFLTNQNSDSGYYGSVAIGTPPHGFNVILDTGSADMWVAGKDCRLCDTSASFDSTASSTYRDIDSSFAIIYGSGAADGVLASDTLQMAGFSLDNQTFGVVNRVSTDLIRDPVSGLLGLGWSDISSSRSTPFWEILASQGSWDEPVMSFQLTRFVNDSSARTLEFGGTFTMGFLNKSLYIGDVEYYPLISQSYWLLPLTSIKIQGQNIQSPDASLAAIDTGTTLIGGPQDVIAQIFSKIPNSIPLRNDMEGYYSYPCSTKVEMSLAFSGRDWSISPADFELTPLDTRGEKCLGAFFALPVRQGKQTPNWIVGDTFLKNVYSVFRYQPPSVGFANLSEVAQVHVRGDVPTQTIGVAPTTSNSGHRVSSEVAVQWLAGGALMLAIWTL